MLDEAGTVRVLDLGLARIADAANPFNKTAAGRLTQSGMFMGTINFMAPEQAEDSHRADHRADIYSLGCTLYYLLTGREPFPGETILKRLNAHAEQPAPSLCSARPAVPASLDVVYRRMMAKRPDDRPASMTEVISQLEACQAAAEALTVTGESPRSRPELKVFDGVPLGSVDPSKTQGDPSVSPLRDKSRDLPNVRELSLEDLGMDVRPEGLTGSSASSPRPAAAGALARRVTAWRSRIWARRTGVIVGSLGAIAVLVAVLARFVLSPAHRATSSPGPPTWRTPSRPSRKPGPHRPNPFRSRRRPRTSPGRSPRMSPGRSPWCRRHRRPSPTSRRRCSWGIWTPGSSRSASCRMARGC